MAEPISIFVKVDKELGNKKQKLIEVINKNFDLSPSGIKKFLNLDKPIYEKTSTYGHFGRKYNKDKGTFSWESLSSVDLFKQNLLC